MGIRKDLTGQRFGRLTVVKRVDDHIQPSGKARAMWLCQCDCGNTTVIRSDALTDNGTKSCGCLAKEITSKIHKGNKHNKKYNTYDLTGEYGIGYTSKGEEFYFDLEDYDLIKDYCWFTNNKGYITAKNFEHKDIYLHRIVTCCPSNLMPDHIHGKETINDNRKSNLRIVSRSQNGMNRVISSNNMSGITGVSFDKLKNKWLVKITENNNIHHLGYYDNFEDAVRTRKEAEEEYFGEYSYDNSQKINTEKYEF